MKLIKVAQDMLSDVMTPPIRIILRLKNNIILLYESFV